MKRKGKYNLSLLFWDKSLMNLEINEQLNFSQKKFSRLQFIQENSASSNVLAVKVKMKKLKLKDKPVFHKTEKLKKA